MAEMFNEKPIPKKYVIAGLKVLMSCGGKRLETQAEKYECDYTGDADIVVAVDAEKVRAKQAQNPHLTLEACEYIMTGTVFYTKLMEYDGFMLHASAVVYEGRAYLFSAPCGTGKSTHTQNWCKVFDGAVILNDDKPAIRIIDSQAVAYGTPWSGKSDKQLNMSVPVGAAAFIERSETNSIEKMSTKDALTGIMSQTVRPKCEQKADMFFKTVGGFLGQVPVYKLRCNMEPESAKVAYEAMRGAK